MTNEDFEMLMYKRFDLTEATLKKKGNEYTVTDDRLDNFKRIALMTGTNPSEVLLGFAIKHFDAVIRMAQSGNTQEYTREYIDEKIGDSISYLILLEALLKEGK